MFIFTIFWHTSILHLPRSLIFKMWSAVDCLPGFLKVLAHLKKAVSENDLSIDIVL